MKRKRKYLQGIAGILIAAFVLTGCGCGKKNADPETQEVLKISITPEPTPTTAPEEINEDAIVSNGNITMVNQYLVDNGTVNSNSSPGDAEDITDENTENFSEESPEDAVE